jgi:hypothetical protein
LDELLSRGGLLAAVRGALAAAPLDAQRGVARAVALAQACADAAAAAVECGTHPPQDVAAVMSDFGGTGAAAAHARAHAHAR